MNQLPFGVRLSTTRSIEQLEAWLSKNCGSRWKVDLEGLSPDLKKKMVSVYFQNEDDKAKFKQAYTKM